MARTYVQHRAMRPARRLDWPRETVGRFRSQPPSAEYLVRLAEVDGGGTTVLLLFDLKADFLTLVETSQSRLLYGADMYEHILAAGVRRDEAIALCRIEPLNGALGHRRAAFLPAGVTPPVRRSAQFHGSAVDQPATPPPLRQESVIVATEWTVLPAELRRYPRPIVLAINPVIERQESLAAFGIDAHGVVVESACIQLPTAPCRCSGRWDRQIGVRLEGLWVASAFGTGWWSFWSCCFCSGAARSAA